MGLCPNCRDDLHEKHTGKYPIQIGAHGKKNIKSRTGECECSKCLAPREPRGGDGHTLAPATRPEVPSPRPTVKAVVGPFRTGAFTDSPCPDCRHDSHWVTGVNTPDGVTTKVVLPVLVPEVLTTGIIPMSKSLYACLGCGPCAPKLDASLKPVVAQ